MVDGRQPAVRTTTAASDVFARVLARLQDDAETYFSAGPVRLIPDGRQQRPFSELLRVAVFAHGNVSPIAHLFVKVFKPNADGSDKMRERVSGDYETTRRVYTSMLPHGDVGAVPPVVCYPDLLAMVTQEVPGPTLLDYLRDHAAWFPTDSQLSSVIATLRTAGRWIQVFQSTCVEAPVTVSEDPRRAFTPALLGIRDIRAYIDHRLQQLVTAPRAGFREPDRYRVLRHIDRLGSEIAPADLRPVPAHADLALGNIIVVGEGVVVLDFAMAGIATRLHDLTRLYVQLELLSVKPSIRPFVIQQLQSALLDGFDPSLEATHPLFRMLVLLHRVNHLTTLSVKRTTFPEAAYNTLVRRQHRRWIASELEASRSIGEA
jgi:hypothetical protein